MRTNAFVMIRHGKIVMEEYARGYTAESAMLTWSVSKGVTNALVGRAVMTKGLDINAPASSCIPELERKSHQSILLRHFHQMSSGLGFDESYVASPVFSSVFALLFSRGRSVLAAFTASFDLILPAGSYWNYSSGDSNLMMRCLKAFYSEKEYAAMPWTELFDPLQIRGAVWERDGAGTFVGSSYLYMRPVDLARIGYLYMHDGVWNGRRLLPEGWVKYSLSVIPAYYNRKTVSVSERADNPAAYWYRNVGNPGLGIEKPWPGAPDDAFAALGHWGKGMWVIPSLDMVVVRLGDDRRYACRWADQDNCEPDAEKAYSKHHLMKLVTETVKK
jgi:CubicO group peptidase (beta-lactamase class C family)